MPIYILLITSLLITSLLLVLYIIKNFTSNFKNLTCKSKACEIAYGDCAGSSSNWASTCDDLIYEKKVNNCNVCGKICNGGPEMKLGCQYFGGPFLDATDECFLKPLSFDNKDKCNNAKLTAWLHKNCKKLDSSTS